MPRRKHLKRQVRQRMAKTGESYVAALAHMRQRTSAATPFWREAQSPERRKLERLLTELWGRLGCSVIADPPVQREWAPPAFRIQPSAGIPFYLDLAVEPQAGNLKLESSLKSMSLRDLEAFLSQFRQKKSKLILARRVRLPIAAAVSWIADRLIDPDLPYVVTVSVRDLSDADAGVIELWAGGGGPRLHISAVLAVELGGSAPAARLYHHPEPRRPLTATPLLRLPQATWLRGRYVYGEGASLASLMG